MADEVIISNVGEDDKSSVASEATMLSLLAAVEKMAKAAGYDPAATRAKTEKKINESLKVNIKESKKYTEALKDKTKATEEATDAIGKLGTGFGLITGALGAAFGAATNLVSELLTGGDRLSDFTRHIPLVGSLITPLAQFMEQTVDNFRNLSSVGAAFGNDLEEMRASAAAARLPLDEFTALITNNSERLMFLGSSVTEGAKRFAQISGELRGNEGLFGSLKAMGFTTEQVNEGLASYINLQGRLGRIEGRTNKQLVQGASEYLMQIDRLAKATGRQREEIEKELETINLDAAMVALENQVINMFGQDSNEYRAFQEGKTMLAALPSEAREAAISAMMGIPNETAAIIGSEFIDAWRGLATGAFPDPDVAKQQMSTALDQVISMFDNPTQLEAMKKMYPDFVSFVGQIPELRRILEADTDAINAEQASRDFIIENLTRFDDRIRDIRSTIETALIESGVFDLLANSMASLANLISGEEGTTAIKNAIKSITSFFENFISDVNSMGFWGAIKKAFVDNFGSIAEEIKLKLFGGTKNVDTPAGTKQVQVDGMFSGLIGELFSLENLLVGGAIVAGVVALSAAFSLVALKAALVLGAVGFAAGGIGYMLEKLEPVIRTIGDIFLSTFDKIPPIVESVGSVFDTVFSNISSIIDNIGLAIERISNAMSGGLTSVINSLKETFDTVFTGIQGTINSVGSNIQGIIDSTSEGISNIITKLTEWETAGTTATTRQIETLSQIDPVKMFTAAAGIEAMKAALEDFGSGSQGWLDSIGSLFGAETSQEQQTSAIERLSVLGPGLRQVGASLKEIAQIENLSTGLNDISENLSTRRLENFNSELERMLEILQDINAELTKDQSWLPGSLGVNAGSIVDQYGMPGANSGTGSSSGTESRLDRLNNTMTELLTVAREQLTVLTDIEDNTDGVSGDISRNGLTAF